MNNHQHIIFASYHKKKEKKNKHFGKCQFHFPPNHPKYQLPPTASNGGTGSGGGGGGGGGGGNSDSTQAPGCANGEKILQECF